MPYKTLKDYVDKKLVMDKKEIDRTIRRMASEIIETIPNLEKTILVGLQTRGVFLAERIAKEIEKDEDVEMSLGTLDISLYRDDIADRQKTEIKETRLPFDIDDKNIILVDDVLFTGRSIRAAMGCIMDFGRPKTIKLAVLIDRGNRELPIQPDFVGKKFVTTKKEIIAVKLNDIDDKEEVMLLEKK